MCCGNYWQIRHKIFQLTGSEAISYYDAAKSISKATGLTIGYHSPSVEEFRGTLAKAGVPAEVVDVLAASRPPLK